MLILESLDIVSEELYIPSKKAFPLAVSMSRHITVSCVSFFHMNSSFVPNKSRKLLLRLENCFHPLVLTCTFARKLVVKRCV